MNYSKDGVKRKIRKINSKVGKFGKKLTILIFGLCILAVIGIAIVGVSAGIGVFKGIIDSAPDISNINVAPTGFSTFIYDSEGNQTAKLVAKDSNRIPVSMDKVPENLQHAFVAIEDERFYNHNGIDIMGIMRAGMTAVKDRNLSQGASTITQQLLKNNVFTSWVSEKSTMEKVKRKIQEQYLAIQLEKVMTKDEILINYMNTINLGQNTLGVQAASLRYFNKNVYELDLSECAVIAAITQNPTRYNPIIHPDNNKIRRNKTLLNMKNQGYITESQYNNAIADDVYARIKSTNEVVQETSINSYFDDAVTEQVYNDLLALGYTETQAYTLLYSGGLSIFSTMDPKIQRIVDEEFSKEENYPDNTKWYLTYRLTIDKADGSQENHSSEMFKAYFKQFNSNFNMLYSTPDDAYAAIEEYHAAVMAEGDDINSESISITPQPQACIILEDQSTGQIVAMMGGRGVKEASRTLNRATSSKRQPGSTFKILSTYAPALDTAGMTLATVENDAPFSFIDGTPVRNWWGDAYKGIQTLREGIIQSENIVTVKCITEMGPELGYNYLLKFGITTLVPNMLVGDKVYTDIHQSLALGGLTKGVTALELNAAYAAIANHGEYIKPKLYTKVLDHDGNVLLDNTANETEQVITPQTAYLLTSAMVDVMTKGTGGSANFANMTVAGKTGTTSDYNDVWMAGYTPYYTASVWVGYDNNTKLKSSAEKGLNKTLWKAVMKRVHEDLPFASFDNPGGIVTSTVCARSGKLPIPGLCDATLRTEIFAEGNVPTTSCDVHYAGTVCGYSRLPACETCPFRSEGVFELMLPADVRIAAIYSGQGATIQEAPERQFDEAGNPIAASPTLTYCPHNPAFMADPNSAGIIALQQQEMANAASAAAVAAAMAAGE